ncbi:MAG: SDR family NAD(P)-dependent oxidoreductase [Myxococcales bacterium]|nr:SDR family NAD(P)-dependent oxidoreductase [Myxococcales bacterium]
MNQERRIAVVTGGSRGVGKGIALALGAHGYHVYVTGRTTGEKAHPLGGTAEETAQAIVEAGGSATGAVLDHGDDDAVQRFFREVGERHGRIDVLVNNATAIPRELVKPGPFWEKSLDLLRIVDVGMRSHYVATHAAAPFLVKAGGALVVFTSSFGGRCYMHGPAYGMGKAGVDKMAMDMAVDFQPFDVASVSLWLGLVKTERNAALFDMPNSPYAHLAKGAESPRLVGEVVAALHADPRRMERSGQVLITAELAAEYGLGEADGTQPPSHRPMLGDPPVRNEAKVL